MGYFSYVFSGTGIKKFFSHEIGHHRFQRIPPTETNGRMHTSTVLVTLIDDKEVSEVSISERDLEVTYTQGSGPGGQRRNRKKNCVILKHIPSGIKVKIDGRNQHQNYLKAKKIIQSKLNKSNEEDFSNSLAKEKRNQIGINNRSNKKRTYNFKTGLIKDHVSKKIMSLRNAYKGKIEQLH